MERGLFPLSSPSLSSPLAMLQPLLPSPVDSHMCAGVWQCVQSSEWNGTHLNGLFHAMLVWHGIEWNGADSFLLCRPPCLLATLLLCFLLSLLSHKDVIQLAPGSSEPFLLVIRSLGELRFLDRAHP